MKSKGLLLLAILFLGVRASAQVIKSQAAFRMLQTAGTLLEAKQFEAAEEYYTSGLLKAKQNKDKYCEAFANEGLGNLYTKQQQPDSAIKYYKNAVKLYKAQKLNVVADVVESMLKGIQGVGDMYAGIEVGAKGVKLSVIDIMLSMDREYGYTLKMDTAINTDAASLSYQSEKETSDAVALLLDVIKSRFKIAANRVYVVVSSGLKQELDKYNKLTYFENVIRPAGMNAAIQITSVTAEQEAELSLLGIVPQKDRFTSGQLDVGSGNTKGGYFATNKIFMPITFPLGTKSFQRMIDPSGKASIDSFVLNAERLWIDSFSKPVIKELVSKREIKSKNLIYLTGGIVWANVAFQHPEAVNNNNLEIGVDEIAAFRNNVVDNYDKLIHPDFSKVSNSDDYKAAGKNIGRVLKTFDQKALIAGAVWLNHLVQEITTINPDKKIVFPKYGYVGWISGYIIKKVTRQYVGLVK